MNFKACFQSFLTVFFAAVAGPLLSSEPRLAWIDVRTAEEIAIPENGYFPEDPGWFFNLVEHNSATPSYGSWNPEPETLPTFGTLPSNRLEAQTKTALLYNRRCFRLLLDKRYGDHTPAFWSVAERKRWEDFGIFGISDSSRRFTWKENGLPAFDLARYFQGNKQFLSKLSVLDLTYLRLDEACYQGLGDLESLEKLALPLVGGALNDNKFVCNPKVEELVVWNTRFSREGLARLAEFNGLKRLVLNGCSLNFTPSSVSANQEGGETSDSLLQLRKRLERLTLVSCDGAIIDLVGQYPWEKLSYLRGDSFPRDLKTKYPSLRYVTLYVDEEHLRTFAGGPGSCYYRVAEWSSPNPPSFSWPKKSVERQLE